MNIRLRTFAVGFCIAAFAALVGLRSSPLQFPNPKWFDGGIRLLRDDNELSFYFSHARWIDARTHDQSLTQDYPPLGVMYFSVPRLAVKDFDSFEVGFLALNVFAYAALFAMVGELLAEERHSRRRLLLLVLPAFLYFALWRFDVLPALLVTSALLAARRKSPETAFVLLLMAAMSKWYAALFFPPFFVYFARMGGGELPVTRLKNALYWTVGCGAGIAAVSAVTIGSGALVEPVLFHLSRDIEEGSVAAVLLTAMRVVRVDWPWLHKLMLKTFLVSQFAAVIPVIWKEYAKDFRTLVRSCVVVLIPFMSLGTVFSAQWIVWLTPIMLIVATRTELALLAVLDVVVFAQFPVLFGIDPYSKTYLAFTLIRTALFAVLWWKSFRAVSDARATTASATPQ